MTLDERARAVAEAALGRPAAERDVFVDEACGDDTALRAAVAALVAAEAAPATTALLPTALSIGGICPACGDRFPPGQRFCPRDAEPLEDDFESLVGATLDGTYRVEAVLGKGGMGVVLRAVHVLLQDAVAIKMLPSRLALDPRWLRRFRREGQAARRFRHPAAVAVYDLRAAAAGPVYLVMEFVEGRTLRAELKARGPLAPSEAVALLAPVAAALGAAHEAGVVHRDVKPENIMIGPGPAGPEARLLDLGVARLDPADAGEEAATRLTHEGAWVGTPMYMAPEQWGMRMRDGETEIDGRADVYALGAVVYEAVTGRPPFDLRRSAELRAAHAYAEPPRADAVAPVVPAAFAAALARALAKDRADRFATPGGLFDALAASACGTAAAATDYGAIQTIDPGASVTTLVAPTPPNNLPLQTTTFVGDAAAVAGLLGEARLVTLTGAGGIGKTRLAIETAARALDAFVDGVWLVELASVSEPGMVVRTAAAALGVREPASGDLLDALRREVGARRLLLVLDNCEHLVDASAALVEALLRSCPNARVLATSREALALDGERVWSVPPLAAPDPEAPPPLAEVARFPAVRLFADRARAILPSFELTERNAATVARIAARLDGIPLAIELAAARVRVLSVDEILARLKDRFRLLSEGGRSRLPRQRTLRAAIDWSYDLLPGDERALLGRLAVFAGDFTLEAAEAVAGDDALLADVLGPLDHLVAKSLVTVDVERGTARYRMFETVREYALEKLEAAGELTATLDRLERWAIAAVDRADAAASTARLAELLSGLRADLDNIRVVLARCVREGRGEALMRLGARLGRFWEAYGFLTEGREWLRRALAYDERTPARVAALYWAGMLALDQGDYAKVRMRLYEALALATELGDRVGTARARVALGFQAMREDDPAAAAHLEEAAAIYREIGNRTGEAVANHQLASYLLRQGELDRAEALLESIHALYRELDERRSLAIILYTLAQVAQNRGDLDRAERFVDESIAIAEALEDAQTLAYALLVAASVAYDRGAYRASLGVFQRALGLDRRVGDDAAAVVAVEGVASALAALGRHEAALRLAGAAEACREARGYPLAPRDRASLDANLDLAQRAAGDADAARLLGEGRRTAFDRAVAAALETQ